MIHIIRKNITIHRIKTLLYFELPGYVSQCKKFVIGLR